MLAEVLLGVTPITLLCVAVVLVPTRLFLDSPWPWRRAALASGLVSALGAGTAFSILASIFADRIRFGDAVAAAIFSAIQALLVVWLLSAVSRLVR